MIRIAIDGPGGAGKSTIAKAVAAKLGIDYIDTGAMYRAVGYKAAKEEIDVRDENALKQMLDKTEIDFSRGNIILDGKTVNEEIRTPAMSSMASRVSSMGVVREKLVSLQKKMGQTKSVIMDGRDIGTNVMPDAEYKFYMTASPEERAKRRYDEMFLKGRDVRYEDVLADINKRDHADMTRKINPLRQADDAVLLDTTGMTIEQVVDTIIKEIDNGSC
ncbi:MAG: (d)CMP kinase [Eubacteriaceae bacterium]|nr:(d)CMP kinase [Eubacteriaceae bacterium]